MGLPAATLAVRLPGRAARPPRAHDASAPTAGARSTPGPGSGVRLWTLGAATARRRRRCASRDADDIATVAAFSPDGRRVLSGNDRRLPSASGRLRRRTPLGVRRHRGEPDRDGRSPPRSSAATAGRFVTGEQRRHRGSCGARATAAASRACATRADRRGRVQPGRRARRHRAARTARRGSGRRAGRLERELSGHTGAVRAVGVQPRGSAGASTGSDDGTARIWMTRKDARRAPRTALPERRGGVQPGLAPPAGSRRDSGRAAVWDLRTPDARRPHGLSSGERVLAVRALHGLRAVGRRRASRARPQRRGARSGTRARAHPAAWASRRERRRASAPAGGRVAVTPIDSDELRGRAPGAAPSYAAVAGGRAAYIPRDSKETVSSARSRTAAAGCSRSTASGDVRLSERAPARARGPGATATGAPDRRRRGLPRTATRLAVAARPGRRSARVRDVASGATRSRRPQPRAHRQPSRSTSGLAAS